MHLEERGMSGPLTGAKPIFPIPISGQTLMFSASNCHSNLCEQGRGSIPGVSHNTNPSRCSCEGLSGTTGFNRLLLPAGTHTDQCTAQLQANLASTASDSWLRIPAAARNSNTYESLLLNGFPLYGKFNNESYPSLDYALLANARRKNATRETTSTLKAWLNEHKKNPYPTKGEKIMLAILTKMTLTQVSTWFANARRRLKKENKMTWSPRKKSGDKKIDGKDDDSDASDSDIECMDVDVDGDPDSLLLEEKETSSTKEMDGVFQLEKSITELETEVQRPSVIRTIDSPTFNEIRDRFKDGDSPVNDLQKWVNGCFQDSNEPADFPVELTPPSTPIENKITTFTSQKLFEAFDASKNSKTGEACIKEEPSYNTEPLHLIFSSRQPVCSTKVLTESSTGISCPKEVPSSVITPQPSPKNIEFCNLPSGENENTVPKIDYRVQGLTTSRELEAVLALTNLCKT